MIYLINSLPTPIYIILLLGAIIGCIIAVIKLKEEHKIWRGVYYPCIFSSCLLILNRIIVDFRPDSNLLGLSNFMTFLSVIIMVLSVIIIGFSNNKKPHL